MAKYIGTYATSGDVQTALDNQELNRPFIAYTTDNDKVYYGPAADKAEAGDIVVYSVADDLLHYIKQAVYSTSTYPVTDYVPVGVVAYPQTDDAVLGPTGEITFMGLNWLDINNPDTGGNGNNTSWGYSNFDIPELTNYANSGTAITDMNGKANTQAVLQYATAQTDWRTASAITWTNAEGYYPAFECAWRYHTSGTIQGDWFVPSCGEQYIAKSFADMVNSGITAVGGMIIDYNNGGLNLFTSTEQNAGYAFHFSGYGQSFAGREKRFAQLARPFCFKLMTHI